MARRRLQIDPLAPLRHPVALILLAFLLAGLAGATPARAAGPTVYLLPTTGIVDGVMASYVADGVAKAGADGGAAVVIELNTPGGSLDSMQQIVTALLAAPLPTIVWVAPSGGRAASAGTFITEAAAVALMAPGTNIGAASPVGAGGQDITGTEGQKVRNDAIANIRSIADARGRNADWAASTVSNASSYTASQAVAQRGVDGIAGSLTEVLAFADGRTVKVDSGTRTVVVHVAGASIVELPMSPWQAALHLLSNPDIAFILFVLGAFGLMLELFHPNLLSGISGGVALILAYVGFGSLPLNVAGLLLVALGIVLFALEPGIPSHGILTIGGLACFVIGASALYTEPGPGLPRAGVDWPILAVMTVAAAGFGLVVVRAALRIRHFVPVRIGGVASGGRLTRGLVGQVQQELAPAGSIHIAGEEWSARAVRGAPLPRGAQVRVVGQEGLVLLVEPVEEAGAVGRTAPVS